MNVFLETGSFYCECGKMYNKKCALIGHMAHCKIHLDLVGKPDHESHYTSDSRKRQGWSKGKTKTTDERVKRNAESVKQHYCNNPGAFLGKTHSDQFKRKMSEVARYNACNHINGWKSGSSKIPNKYEQYTEEFLSSNSIKFQKEVVIPNGSGYYQADFIVGDVDLEIDGTGHNFKGDERRDKFMISKGYVPYHIVHHDSIDELHKKLVEFLKVHQ